MKLVFGGLVILALTAGICLGLHEQSHPSVPVHLTTCMVNLPSSFTKADVVATGKVFAVLPAAAGEADVILTPRDVYRGRLDHPTFTVVARDNQFVMNVRSVETLNFVQNQTYFLVLRRRSDGRYSTSLCDGSRVLNLGLTSEERHLLDGPLISHH